MKVIITTEGFIPGLGYGPYLEPTEISRDKYFTLKKLGITVVDVTAKVPVAETGLKNRIITKAVEPSEVKIEDTPIDIIEATNEVVEEPTEEVKEVMEDVTEVTETVEDVIEDTTEEVTTEEVSELEGDELTQADLEAMTKKEIITLLTDNGIEVDTKLNKANLVTYAVQKLFEEE